MTVDKVFLRYVLAVVVNTLAGAGVMFVMYNFLHLGYWGSSALNYIAGSIIVFFINKYWTFKMRQWSLYMIVCYAANILISYFLAFRIARTVIYFLLEHFTEKTRDHAALAVGMLLYVVINYVGQRYIVFNSHKIFSKDTVAPVENHREREKGTIVYPVHSRRAGGLSIGINLFPDKKSCPFNCPYCEVFPFTNNAAFSLERMEHDLRAAIAAALEQKQPIKDICFSGNGEPSLSPAFPDALKLATAIRDELVPSAEMVLITCGAGLVRPEIFSLLRDAAAGSTALNIWLKLDAGTPDWYQKMNRAAIPFAELAAAIKEFAACAPVTIQTMLCTVDGESPSPDEVQAWETLLLKCAADAKAPGGIRKVQLYGKARSAPEDPKAQAVPPESLETRAESLRQAFATAKIPQPPIEVFP